MIPVYQPFIGEREKQYVMEALDSTWISSRGLFLDRFEREFAAYVNSQQGIAVSNGTVALHLALAALGIGPGDEVIVPTLTYVASINAIKYVGATPVFVDSEPQYWNLDPAQIERLITPHTRAIEVVHLYGHPASMDEVAAVASRHGLAIIEDAAEAHGAMYRDRKVGSIGTVSTFSFFGNKIVTTGEGGMVVTSDSGLAETARHLRGQGVSRTRTYWHDVVGYNYRMTNIAAAIGCAQLERVDQTIEAKRRIAGWYREHLDGIPGLTLQGEAPWARSVYWMNSVLVDANRRDPLMNHLASQGIETRPFFYPAHTLPMYRTGETFPVAERLGASGINLPSFTTLTREDVATIAGHIRRFLETSAG